MLPTKQTLYQVDAPVFVGACFGLLEADLTLAYNVCH